MNIPGYQEPQRFNHGSAAGNNDVNDPTGVPPVIPVAMDGLSSEDSLTFSPPKKVPLARSVPAGSLKRAGRGERSGGSKRPTSLPRPPSGRVTKRPPSPALHDAPRRDDGHVLCAPDGVSVEHRLAALETQQKLDHEYFVKIRETLGQLHRYAGQHEEKFKEIAGEQTNHIQLGVQLRRELYGVRDKLQKDVDDVKTILQDNVHAKFLAIEAQVNVMQAHIETSKGMEAKFSAYLTSREEQRPQEGKTVSDAFQAVTSEVNRVKHLIGQIEQPSSNIFQQQAGGVMTKEMIDALRWMQSKVVNHDMQLVAIPDVITRLSMYGQTTDALSTSCADFSARIAEMEQFNAAASAAQGGIPAGSGPAATAPAWTPPGFGNGPVFVPGGCCGGASPPGGAGGATHVGNQSTGGKCHCEHLDQLAVRVQELEDWRRRAPKQDPWNAPREGPGDSGAAPDPNDRPRDLPGPGHGGHDMNSRKSLPLNLYGGLGSVGYKDRSIFDEKFTMQEEYRFNGVKNGEQWKIKLERYFIARAPILKEILEFAEREDMQEITVQRFRQAAGHALTEEQMQNVNAAIWGFLAGCLTGSAEALFERAETLNGLDAWRRVVRHIDHGREIHLETLRREMKTMHNRAIRDIHGVEEGIANFENTLYRYIKAGGTPMRDNEKKSDLLQILPDSIRRDLLWHATDGGSFDNFRDLVLAQSQKVILNTRRGINAVDERASAKAAEDESEGGLEDMIAAIGRGQVPQLEDLVAAVGRYVNYRGKPGRDTVPMRRPPRDDGDKRNRQPRKCPNCNKEHPERICPYPAIDKSKRRCWICDQEGHQSNACPNKKAGAPIKAIEDQQSGSMPFFGVGLVDEQGFTKVVKGSRPMPTQAKLASFVTANSFESIGIGSVTKSQRQRKQANREARASADTGHVLATAATEATAKPEQHGVVDVPPPPAAHSEARRPRGAKTRFAQCCDHDCGCPEAPSTGGQTNDDIENIMKAGIDEAELIATNASSERIEVLDMVIDQEREEPIMAATAPVKKAKVASDSGAVANVIHPEMLPDNVEFVPNTTGFHFVNAQGGIIEKFGSCKTVMKGSHGEVGCGWQAADVAKALHSVSQTTGPIEKPRQDVLYNAARCVVVPPGVVEWVMKHLAITPVMEYKREGNLWTAEVELSSFPRPGQSP